MHRHPDVDLAVQQIYSVPDSETIELTAQLPDSLTNPVLAVSPTTVYIPTGPESEFTLSLPVNKLLIINII